MEEQTIEQKESVKLTRGAKGLYQWEIKLKNTMFESEDLKRLEKIDADLKKTYPCFESKKEEEKK